MKKQWQPRGWQVPPFHFTDKLFADAAGGQRAHQRTHHGQVFLATRQALAHQVVGGRCQVAFLQRHVGAEAVEEGELEVGRLTQRAVRADLYAVAAEDAAVEREGIAVSVRSAIISEPVGQTCTQAPQETQSVSCRLTLKGVETMVSKPLPNMP